jgi:2-dehydropantoate 2-reductase
MPDLKNIYLCGLGALGGMYAERLHAAPGVNLRILASPERIHRYQHEGVRVNGAPLALAFLAPQTPAPKADLLLISVKWHDLENAIEAVRPFVGADTIILSLLNGIESEAVLGRAFGMEKLLYSFVVETDAVREGQNIRYSRLGTVVFGQARNATLAPAVLAVRELLTRAEIPQRTPEDMLRALWWKFMLNVGVNQISAILRVSYAAFQTCEDARALVRQTCLEVVRIAEKSNIALSEADIDAIFPILARLSPEKKTSMLQDVEAGRKTEVEIFGGTVTALGKRLDVPTPMNETLVRMIRVIEQRSTADESQPTAP